MQIETRYQKAGLPKLKLPTTKKNCLFIGSGDSYAAALAAEYLSGKAALCCHPSDVISNPSIVSGREVYVVSISGNTRANISAALAAKKQGSRITAITADPTSRLSNVCHCSIELKYKSAGFATAGTVSFTSSMLVCASLATRIHIPSSIDNLYQQAEKQASLIARSFRDRGNYFILGDSLLYPIALYGAFKFNEVFGANAAPFLAEEFCHSPLFSAKKSDQVIMIGKGNESKKLDERLNQEGFSSFHINFDSTGIVLLLHATFFMQMLVIKLAHKRKLRDCYFLKSKRMLRTSSDFIYG